jgi:hypothetical protein
MDMLNPALLEDTEVIPPSVHKNYDVAIVYGPNSKAKSKSISELKSE